MIKVIIIDFEDSFVKNLSSLFKEIGYSDISLCHHSNFDLSYITGDSLVVLGPGPGRTSDYESFKKRVEPIIGKVPMLGVCLGHQILGEILGFQLMQLKKPLHGKSICNPKLNEFIGIAQLKVQFYNSWALKFDSENATKVISRDGVVDLFHCRKAIGVQFHVESVGTNYPRELLERLLNILYNETYGVENQNRWNLR